VAAAVEQERSLEALVAHRSVGLAVKVLILLAVRRQQTRHLVAVRQQVQKLAARVAQELST
jgi:hypothetical protein